MPCIAAQIVQIHKFVQSFEGETHHGPSEPTALVLDHSQLWLILGRVRAGVTPILRRPNIQLVKSFRLRQVQR